MIDSVIDRLAPDIRRLVSDAPAPGRNCARSAVRHLDRADGIRAVDPEMTLFRLITAQEEAAAAIIHSVRRWRYPNAERLNPKSHVHKLGLLPFLISVQTSFQLFSPRATPVLVNGPTAQRFRMRLPGDLTGKGFIDPPLDITIQENDSLYDFRHGLNAFAKFVGVDSLLKHVRDEVALRRQLLYGSTEGYWVLDRVDDAEFDGRSRDVFFLLLVFLMIDPFPKQQLLVRQCLPILLQTLELLSEDENDPGVPVWSSRAT